MAPLWTSSTSKLKLSPVTSNNRRPTARCRCIEDAGGGERERGGGGGHVRAFPFAAVCGVVEGLVQRERERENTNLCRPTGSGLPGAVTKRPPVQDLGATTQ